MDVLCLKMEYGALQVYKLLVSRQIHAFGFLGLYPILVFHSHILWPSLQRRAVVSTMLLRQAFCLLEI